MLQLSSTWDIVLKYCKVARSTIIGGVLAFKAVITFFGVWCMILVCPYEV